MAIIVDRVIEVDNAIAVVFCRELMVESGLANFFELVHSNGFNSPSMVGINSVTVG